MLVAALLVVYFESKMREQNHKISSMFSLVTAITDELNSVKMIALRGGGGEIRFNSDNVPPLLPSQERPENSITLIEVSDDENREDNDDEDSDSSSGSNADSESEPGSESDSEEKPVIIEIGGLKPSNVKILNVNMMPVWAGVLSEHNPVEEEEEEEEACDTFSSDSSSESGNDSGDDDAMIAEEIVVVRDTEVVTNRVEKEAPEIIDLTELLDEEDATTVVNIPEIKIEPGVLGFNLKSIHISNLEEFSQTDPAVIDYAKASLNKLRQVAVVKGLVEDSSKASKLKKGELLKLLGVSE